EVKQTATSESKRWRKLARMGSDSWPGMLGCKQVSTRRRAKYSHGMQMSTTLGQLLVFFWYTVLARQEWDFDSFLLVAVKCRSAELDGTMARRIESGLPGSGVGVALPVSTYTCTPGAFRFIESSLPEQCRYSRHRVVYRGLSSCPEKPPIPPLPCPDGSPNRTLA